VGHFTLPKKGMLRGVKTSAGKKSAAEHRVKDLILSRQKGTVWSVKGKQLVRR